MTTFFTLHFIYIQLNFYMTDTLYKFIGAASWHSCGCLVRCCCCYCCWIVNQFFPLVIDMSIRSIVMYALLICNSDSLLDVLYARVVSHLVPDRDNGLLIVGVSDWLMSFRLVICIAGGSSFAIFIHDFKSPWRFLMTGSNWNRLAIDKWTIDQTGRCDSISLGKMKDRKAAQMYTVPKMWTQTMTQKADPIKYEKISKNRRHFQIQ